jgi:hypothetical protein
MRPGALFLVPFLVASCNTNDSPDHSREWLRVLSHKKAADSRTATPTQKQVYADSLAAFVETHPGHSRAREVYEHIQLDFARELTPLSRHRDALRFYRAVLAHDPQNADALRGMRTAVEQLSVSRDKLLALQKGMSQREVVNLLGKPIPGWSVRTKRRDSVIESWYFRKNDGGIAGVYFRDGELFAAEENSQAKLAPLTHAAE